MCLGLVKLTLTLACSALFMCVMIEFFIFFEISKIRRFSQTLTHNAITRKNSYPSHHRHLPRVFHTPGQHRN
jgi:hypothetical protein